MSSCSMQPIRAIVVLLIPCGHGSIQSVTQFNLISRMEMRLRAPVTRGYFFLLGALRLVNAASPRNIDEKKMSSGTQGSVLHVFKEI